MRLPDPGRHKLRTEGDHEQYGQLGYAIDDQVEQFERGRVDPMGVLENQQHRTAARKASELPDQNGESLLASTLGFWRKRRIPSLRRHTKQVGNQRRRVGRVLI